MRLTCGVLVPALACCCSLLYLATPTQAVLGSLSFALGGNTFSLTASEAQTALIGLTGVVLTAEALLSSQIIRARRFGKRSTDRAVAKETEMALHLVLKPFLDAELQVDATDCVKLLVCELFRRPEVDAAGERVKSLFEDLGRTELQLFPPDSGTFQFGLAALIGRQNATVGTCVDNYPACSLPADTIINVLARRLHTNKV